MVKLTALALYPTIVGLTPDFQAGTLKMVKM
jgi:hypothetical protein